MTQGRFHAFALSLAGTRHRGAATLAALALALLLAGCGGGGGGNRLSKSEYEHHIQSDGRQLRSVFAPLSKPPTSLAVLAAEIKTGQDKLRLAANELESITPPREIEQDNKTLVAGLRKLANELEPLRQGAANGDVKLVQQAVNGIQGSRALREAQRATADMKKKGYKLGTLGR
jgi:hypothetical protein